MYNIEKTESFRLKNANDKSLEGFLQKTKSNSTLYSKLCRLETKTVSKIQYKTV